MPPPTERPATNVPTETATMPPPTERPATSVPTETATRQPQEPTATQKPQEATATRNPEAATNTPAPVAAPTFLDVGSDEWVHGRADALVTIIEYADFQ